MNDGGMPQTDEAMLRTLAIRERYRQWVTYRLSQRRRSPARVVLGLLFLTTVVLIPAGLILIVKGLMKRNPRAAELAEELEFIENAEAVMAAPVMVNSMLRQPGDRAVPGLFILTFERGDAEASNLLADVACAIDDPTAAGLPEADSAALSELMFDETYRPGRRRPLPGTVTRGHAVYAVDLAVHPWYLVDRHLSDDMPFIPCLAEPGPTGRTRAIPYWCLSDMQPPEIALRCPVFRS